MNSLLLIYLVPLLGLWTFIILRSRRRTRMHLAVLEDNRQAGLIEPNSLHPVIDPSICLGCGSCAAACPEKTILGIIDGKAALIEPTMCVGHGACQQACPTSAISLVFGTATRGVEIPVLSPEFETNIPGIYIAGELGGMGLIKNAIEQGRQAIEFAARQARKIKGEPGVLDCVIVGAGPAGIAASLGAIERKISFVTIDQSTLGGTVAHFPRGKVVMTGPAKLPLVGKFQFSEVSKEALLAFWEKVLVDTGLQPQFGEQVIRINRKDDLFEVVTDKNCYLTRTALLAIGRRGTPRKLEVPGEELDKVVYHLIDPEQYASQSVLVFGGGDSALEAAARIADQPGTEVTLSYRGAAFSRARAKNRSSVEVLAASGRIALFLGSTVERIESGSVTINLGGELLKIPNDSVLICAGGNLPTQFLHDSGISVEKKFGTA